MTIELLWIVPVIAVTIFFLIIALNHQKKNKNGKRDLHKEVEEYNRGASQSTNKELIRLSETRLNEIEKTIQLVSTTISNQQHIIESFRGKDAKFADELKELKQKLLQLQKEYDLLVSENYTLRARLNKIESLKNKHYANSQYVDPDNLLNLNMLKSSKGIIDTLKTEDVDDTSEFFISELK